MLSLLFIHHTFTDLPSSFKGLAQYQRYDIDLREIFELKFMVSGWSKQVRKQVRKQANMHMHLRNAAS